MDYSNKAQLNQKFKCVLCESGEHGLGRNGKYVCFECIKKLVIEHDVIVRPEHKIITL
ncbi:hypothetical protein D3C75_532460 [compost metagenome]